MRNDKSHPISPPLPLTCDIENAKRCPIPGPRTLSVVSPGNFFALPSSMCNTYVAQNVFSHIVLFSPIRFNAV